MLSLESELKGESSFDGLLAEAGGKPMSSGSIFLYRPPRLRVLNQAGRDSGMTRPFANDKLELRSGV